MRPLAIAIDLGGTLVRAALIDEAGTILTRATVETKASAGAEVVIAQLYDLAMSVRPDGTSGLLLGVGVSSPGPLDAQRGIALAIPTLAGFVNVPLTQMLEDRLSLPVQLENDGIAAALGEWRFGAAQGFDNVVYVTVSTGIGGGIIVDGRVLRGRQGMAGHVGHMTIVQDGELCVCGNRGCWEAYGAGPFFARRAAARALSHPASLLNQGDGSIDARRIFAAAAQGDALASALVSEEADILGIGIVNLLHLYSPDIVVIGGGVSNGLDLMRPALDARIAQGAMPPFRPVPVVPAALGGNSGLVGAATLVFDASSRPKARPA